MIYASTITEIQKGDKILFYPTNQTLCFVRNHRNLKFQERDDDKIIFSLIKTENDFFQIANLIAEIKGLEAYPINSPIERKAWCCEFK